jgi:excinuclease ABC subunit B
MEEAEAYNKGKTAKKGAGALMKNPNDVIAKLEEEMRRAAKELNFERAAMLRDRIQNIRSQLEE